jgi:hypothetical protein
MSDGGDGRQQLRDLIDRARRGRADATPRCPAATGGTVGADLPAARIAGREGHDAVGEQLSGWFDGYREGPGYEARDLEVDADGDLGYCSFAYHVTAS